MTKADCYKALSDMIAENLDWVSADSDKDKLTYYIMGLNDMTRYIAEMIDDVGIVDDEHEKYL